jgi:aromatic-L-amino-acid decarboxylase
MDEDLHELLSQVTDYVLSAQSRIADQPVADFTGIPEMLASSGVRRPPPEQGRSLTELLRVVDEAASKGMNVPSGGLLAYVPSSGLVSSAAADLVAGALNRFTGHAASAPGLVALEVSVLRWIADLFGLPEDAIGTFTTGGSTATLSALVTARAEMLGEEFADGIVYVTAQTHGCVAKAAFLAGFPRANVRVVGTDSRLAMDPVALRAAIAADRQAGLRPFCVVASAGTTNTGTIDPLPALADLAVTEDVWLHVDAAYGGFFQLTERGRERLAGIERADSIVVDPHKGLFVSMGSGCLLVRDGTTLRRAHTAAAADYLQDARGGGELPDFADHSLDLTRNFRGLRVWLPLHLHGVAAFREALDDKLDLAELVYADLSVSPHLVTYERPELSTVVLRLDDDDDERTVQLMRRINAEGRVHLSSTRIDDRFAIRICILHHRVDKARIHELLVAIRRHSARLAAY